GGWFRAQGQRGQTGLRLVSIIGDVCHPGAYEITAGLTFGELLAVAGGMPAGDELQAIAPAGPLGGFLPAVIPSSPLAPARGEGSLREVRGERLSAGVKSDSSGSFAPHPGSLPLGGRGSPDHLQDQPNNLLDLPLDPTVIADLGARLGSTFIVLNQRRNFADFTRHCLDLFARESCGKCVPCRLGTRRLVELFAAVRTKTPSDDSRQLVGDLRHTMRLTSLCDLGRVAVTPLDSWLRYGSVSAHEPVG
ncbi:MAG: SLBB domain-containing protein, partial [Planctomycetales bacterium]|nr:SLBB domain-containing protein [Planctomycetales bacterium]